MTVTHSAAVRNTLATAILTAIDQDVGAGNLVFRTVGDVEVATLPFSDPAGTVTAERLTFSAITSDTSATGGTVAKATLEDNSGDQIVLTDAVQTSGGDINMSSLAVTALDTVSCSALTYDAPL